MRQTTIIEAVTEATTDIELRGKVGRNLHGHKLDFELGHLCFLFRLDDVVATGSAAF